MRYRCEFNNVKMETINFSEWVTQKATNYSIGIFLLFMDHFVGLFELI